MTSTASYKVACVSGDSCS